MLSMMLDWADASISSPTTWDSVNPTKYIRPRLLRPTNPVPNLIARVTFDGITGHTIYTRFLERRREFLREFYEYVDASLK